MDAYWEVDLGETFALSSVRAIPATGFDARLTHATVRAFDAEHESVFSRELDDADFDVDLDGPLLARYVRIGFEHKERSSPDGSIEWYLGLKELQVFGCPASEVGILDFSVFDNTISSGQSTILSWDVAGVESLWIYPDVGSVGTNALGEGSMLVSPTESTTYFMVATNRYHVFTQFATVTVDGQAAPLQISEFVADNALSLRDGYGDASDWIELFNPRDVAVDLAGYGLSDNPALPMKWVFPSVFIPAHGHLMVFASGKNESIDPKGFLHADWKLDAGGEDLVLTAPDGVTTLDSILAFPVQGKDLAYGRNLQGTWRFMEPTPSALNRSAEYEGWLASLDFSHKRGFYTNAFALAVSNPNPDSVVTVSLDGSEPQTPYSSALNIAGTKTVRAAVSRLGYRSPKTKTHSYIFIEDVATSPVMNTAITHDPLYAARLRTGLTDLPTLSIAVPELPDDYVKCAASVEVLWPDGTEGVQENCGMVRYGGAWTTFSKKNYRLKFSEQYGSRKLKAPLFSGMDRGFPATDSFDELELGGGSHDMNQRGFYMSARFVEDSMLDMGSLNPHGRFVHLYINGTYWGQFHLRERLVEHFLADYLGGETEEYFNVRGNDNVGSAFIPGTPDPVYRDSWTRVRDLGGNYQAVKDYLDVPSLIDFMLLWFYGNCETEYRAAGPAEAGSGFKFWLADADGFLRTTTSDNTGNSGPGSLFDGLNSEADPDFKILLADRIQKHFFHGGALTPEQNSSRLSERMTEIEDSLIAECARWGYRTPENWTASAENIQNNLFPGRTGQLFAYLRARGMYPSFDPPVYSQQGGSVSNGFELTMSTPVGTIYYTLDGSDPRLPGGGISPNALIYTNDSTTTSLVDADSSWHYWDGGSIVDSSWKTAGYSDAAWSTGIAELGYGDGDESTTLSYGSNPDQKHITTYFRKTFSCADASAMDNLTLDLLRDDGAAIYLNGTELMRENMPAGAITSETLASSAVAVPAESTFFTFNLPSTLLQTGENLLAIELHQALPTSSDISFNLGLEGIQNEASTPLILSSNTVLRSRVWTGTEWSALNEAQFLMAERVPAETGNILITEIHYNPSGYLDDHEFIEIWNSSTNLVDLTGAALSGGVAYAFLDGLVLSPNTFAVVVEDTTAFQDRYQTASSPWYHAGITVCGEWEGRLGNDGERITLMAANGTEILAVPYGNTGDWPQRADGKGSSLELKTPETIDPSQPGQNQQLASGATWQSSSLHHGSPGRFDDFPRAVVLNEVLAHTDLDTDWIELHNRSTQDVDLSGLYLSDDFDMPLRYKIPNTTVIATNGYLSFGAAELGFAFSELGSEALLVLAEGTNVLRFLDSVDFPAVEREEPFGRYQRSDGETDFTELRAISQNTSSALPRVGPLVFSEIMYSPATGKAEYVEIVNITDADVLLYDPMQPANRWELSAAVSYTFPSNQVASPCIPLIICSTNPAAFRTQYGLDESDPVYGPWEGLLNNAGESLKLRKPGDPEPDGFVPYYRVDRVVYRPVSPWPASASTGGISLQRNPLEGYGNDPVTWEPLGGTPGQTTGNHPPIITVGGSPTAPEEEELLLTIQGLDFDAPWQTLTLSASNLPPAASFDPSTGQFSWTPDELDGPGTFTPFFIAKDSACSPSSVTQAVEIVVQEVNRTPILSPIADQSYPAGLEWNLGFSATDPDRPLQTLTFAQTGLPSGLSLNPSTGELTGIPGEPGDYTVQIIVSDDHAPPLTTTNTFQMSLSEVFQISNPVKAGGTIRFSFPGLAGETYCVEATDALNPPDWKLLQQSSPAQSEQIDFEDATTHTQRFYRIRWLQP